MDTLKTLTVRIPPELAQYLEDLAARERRSVNAQIIVIIEAHKAQDKKGE